MQHLTANLRSIIKASPEKIKKRLMAKQSILLDPDEALSEKSEHTDTSDISQERYTKGRNA